MKLHSKYHNSIIFCSYMFCFLQIKLFLCAKVFKERLHVISEITLRPDYLYNSHDEWYLTNEYIDRGSNVSSMKLFDVWEDMNKIYYNELDLHKSLEYDEKKHVCRAQTVYKMPLAKLRRILIHILPSEKLFEKYTDLGMGPSTLVYAIEELFDKFYYVKSEYNEKSLAMVDVYDMVTDSYETSSTDKFLVITVSVLSKDMKAKKPILTSLADVAYSGLDILSIVLCNNDKKSVYMNRLGQIINCPYNDLIANIEFKFISEIMGGTLIGQDLDKSKEFDFNLNPFMQPVGIGCWDSDEGCIGDKKFYAPSLQFSAEYKTANGSKGLSYVAFDGYRRILRLDRNDRKSIYDLKEDLSYHIGKYNLFEKEKIDLLERAQNCIVMNYDRKLMNNNVMMERLLGISLDKSGCHLGSKVVDHILYYVYEIELKYGQSNKKFYNLPILLETSKFLLPLTFSSNKRYFLTYYVEEFPNSPDVNGFDQFSASLKDEKFINIPKFIELWERNTNDENYNYEKKLINRLEFTEFSWSLDVEPSGDPQSQDSSYLFNIKSCQNERSHELQMRYRLSPYISEKDKLSAKLSQTLTKNSKLIKEVLQKDLSKKLDIPLLNIVDFNIVKHEDKNSFIVGTKIIELHIGIMYKNLLGYTKYIDMVESLHNSILNVHMNRHSIDECRLDSLSAPKRNTLMFCQGLTVCVLFAQDDVSVFIPNLMKQKPTEKNLLSPDLKESECSVEQFSWAQLIKGQDNSILKRVDDNYHRLIGSEVEFKLRYKESQNSNAELIKFRGYTHAVEVNPLDPKGLSNLKKALVGIKYTTMTEEPSAINMNLAFKLKYFNHNVFKYCQLACQLDEYCASFSICSRKNVNYIQQTDCILSTLSLTPERIKDIEQLSRANDSVKTNFLPTKYKVTTYVDSQEFIFKKDDDCSIHPKDSLSSYKMNSMLRIKSNITNLSEQSKDFGFITTLEDCADKDFEASQWNNLARSNFTYCPMGSVCILEDDDVNKLANDQRCLAYEKAHTQFYGKKPYTRMSVQLQTNSTSTQQNQKTDDPKQQQVVNVAKSIQGLTTEQCARDCNLLKSKCLAFDTCQVNPTTTICNLYSVRSQFTLKQNKLIGYLEEEKQFYNTLQDDGTSTKKKEEKNYVKFYSSTECNHYFLNDVYFNIRLSQLLDLSGKEREKASNLEQDLINEDQKRSDNILNIGGINQENYPVNANDNDSSGTLNFILLLMGTLIGSLGFVYGGHILRYSLDMCRYLHVKRSERMLNPRISQLGLTNNLEM